MRKIAALLALLLPLALFADTPPPGAVKIKGGTDGTNIGNVGNSLKVNVTNSVATNVTVTASALPTNAAQEAGGHLASMDTKLSTINTTLGSPFQSGGSIGNSSFGASQIGSWTVQQGTPPWSVSQSGSWTTGRTWNLSSGSDSVSAAISNFPATTAVTQSTSPWVTSRNWNLIFASDKIDASGSSVSVSNFPATFGVTQSTSPWVTSRNWNLSSGLDSVNVGNFPVGQNVTVTASALPTGAATSSNQTNGSQITQVSNFPSNQAITGTVTANQGTTPWVVGAHSVTANAGSGTFTVGQSSGSNLHVNVDNQLTTTAVTQSTSPWVITGTVTAVQPAGSSLHVSVDTAPSIQVTQGTSPWVNNVTQFGGASVVTGTGLSGAGIPRVTVSTDSLITTNAQGTVSTNTPAYIAGQVSPLSLNLRGGLRVKQTGFDSITLVRRDYSSISVTATAYTALITSTANEINSLSVFDSSGQDFVLATGSAGSEVDQISIPPGGWDAPVMIYIPSGSRVSIKSKAASATAGILLLMGLK